MPNACIRPGQPSFEIAWPVTTPTVHPASVPNTAPSTVPTIGIAEPVTAPVAAPALHPTAAEPALTGTLHPFGLCHGSGDPTDACNDGCTKYSIKMNAKNTKLIFAILNY